TSCSPASWSGCGVAVGSDACRSSPGRRHVLGLHELQEPLGAPLAAEAALLGAAERGGRVRDQASVEADHPALQALRQAQAAGQVGGVEVADEAVLGVVDRRQQLRLVLEAD